MKAITIFQPWASLIMIGAKPYEFRKWSFTIRKVGVRPGDFIGLHASARSIRAIEVLDLLRRLDDDKCSTGLVAKLARPLLERLRDAPDINAVIPRMALLGTVRIGQPVLSTEAMPKWKGEIADSDRLEHCKWAWPITDIRPTLPPTPMRGARGFFNIPEAA